MNHDDNVKPTIIHMKIYRHTWRRSLYRHTGEWVIDQDPESPGSRKARRPTEQLLPSPTRGFCY